MTLFVASAIAATLLCTASLAQDDTLAAQSRAAKGALIAGRYSEAAKLYRELAASLPDNPGPRLSLAVALERGGHPAEAVPELDRVIRAQPESFPAWFLLGLAYQQLGQPEKAIAPLRKAVVLDGSNVQAQIELADAELVAGDPRRAIDGFHALAVSHPDMAKAWQGLGLSYVTLGERASKRLNEVAPQSAYWNALLARARAAEGRNAEALSLYGDALRQSPALPGLHAARADIYRQTKHTGWAATEEAREAQVPKPDCSTHAAACAYLAGDWSAAVAAAGQNAVPENLYWASLACARLADGNFQRVAALPPSAGIHELLAEADQRTCRRVEAVAEWRK
ncbi:MAG: tetratricopeptide repeat protein, partial [Bryobacteraceae bacterium]